MGYDTQTHERIYAHAYIKIWIAFFMKASSHESKWHDMFHKETTKQISVWSLDSLVIAYINTSTVANYCFVQKLNYSTTGHTYYKLQYIHVFNENCLVSIYQLTVGTVFEKNFYCNVILILQRYLMFCVSKNNLL